MPRHRSRESLFWTSYADLMTSMFFVMLVLFALFMISNRREVKKNVILREQADSIATASKKHIEKIRQIDASTNNIDPRWFEYNKDFKKHVLKVDVRFNTNSSDINDLGAAVLSRLDSAGHAIEAFLDRAETDSVLRQAQYLLVIEGQASKDSYKYNDQLSYQRALALYRHFNAVGIKLDRKDKCEVLICGSGVRGTLRIPPDKPGQIENQRFLIHILPKPGLIDEK